MDNLKKLTDDEKSRLVAQIETGLAFGGGKLSPEGRQNVESILNGDITADEACVRLDAKYKR